MFVIPMAGKSKRFFDAGFSIPKFMLEAHGRFIFDWSLLSFDAFFDTENFLFICNNNFDTENFVKDRCKALGIKNFDVIKIKRKTKGQADTVSLGLQEAGVSDKEALFVFNIDTFRKNFSFPDLIDDQNLGGYLECFVGDGPNWSNAIVINAMSNTVIKTTEKQQSSNLCCTGLYYFSSTKLYKEGYERQYLARPQAPENSEHYVSLIYNQLILMGNIIKVFVIDRSDVIFCGIPNEYTDFLNSKPDVAKSIHE